MREVCYTGLYFLGNVLIPTKSTIQYFFFFSSRRRHTRFDCDWSSDVCSSDLTPRDWADLRDFGADSDVLNSIGGCATAAEHRAPATLPLAAAPMPARLAVTVGGDAVARVRGSEEHTSELHSQSKIGFRLLLGKKKHS